MTGLAMGMGVELWTEPRAGMLLWCRLPENRDSAEVARAALASDLVLAPGERIQRVSDSQELYARQCRPMQDERAFEVLRSIFRA